MKDNLPKRKHPRLKEYDYSEPGAYFITICTKSKEKSLWKGEFDVQDFDWKLVGARFARPSKHPPLANPTATHKMPPYSSPLPQKRVALNSRACSLVPLTGVVPFPK